MVLADALSRLPYPANNAEVHLDACVDAFGPADVEYTEDEHKNIALINFLTAKQQQLRTETDKDPVLKAVMAVV